MNARLQMMQDLDELLDAYFDCGVLEGREGRSHDTENGAAQNALCAIREHVRKIVMDERDACADVIEKYPYWLGNNAKKDIARAIRARSNAKVI